MVATPDLERGWKLSDPRRDRTLHPYTDADTATILDQAVAALVVLRAPTWLDDPGPTLSVLVSLGAEAGGRVDEAVAEARDQGYSWDQIAGRLATTATAARRRHAGCVAWRRVAL